MENFEFYVLKFEEVMSILYDINIPLLTRFNGSKWDPANVIDETKLKAIMEESLNVVFTNQDDKALKGASFVEWNVDEAEWKFIPPFEKFFEYLFKEYGNSYCVYADSDADAELVRSSRLFMDNILNMFEATFPKYKAVYDALEAEKNQLLRGVTGTTTAKNYSKFKDTPQSEITLEELDSDDLNTNATINEGVNTFVDERDTPIARIKEIEERYVSLYEEWLQHFKQFFWE